MKRRISWKVIAIVCMVAMILPIFSALSPVTATASAGAPLPYAMESFGQTHADIYSTTSAITVNGTMSSAEKSAYVLVDEFGQSSSSSDGVFITTDNNGASTSSIATEFRPKQFSIYAAYDDEYLYFYYELISRTYSSSKYALAMFLGTNFGETSESTMSGAKVYSMLLSTSGGAAGSGSGTDYEYAQCSALTDSATDSTGTYNQNLTTYEIKIARSSFDLEDGKRLYLYTRLGFYNGSAINYLHYGLSKDLTLPTGQTIGEAFTEAYGSTQNYIPHVINMMGEAPAGSYEKPEITSLTATANDSGHSYTADFSVNTTRTVTERGILKADTASIGATNLSITDTSAKNTLSSNSASFKFSISSADNNKFISLRPYVKYSDGTVTYGAYTTVSNTYYDAENKEYEATYNILMIGCSFNYYYLDELIRIAEADNIKLNICNTYWSGVPAKNTWNWLIHDYTNDASQEGEDVLTFISHIDNPAGTTISTNMSTKECLAWKENLERPEWDFISVQDHYGINESHSYQKCMEESVPYLPNIFRYLEATEPSATLLMHQTWSFQVGYTSGAGNMESSAQQAAEHENIKKTIYTISKMMNPPKTLSGYDYFPVVPSGNAWALARANANVGDTLCCSGAGGTTGGDNYHDGTTGGGQYLNACVWYETITGKSCVGNTWRPSEYTLSEARIEALQASAHQAVADLYGTDYAK